MAIQDTIEFNCNTREGRFLQSFVIRGEQGDADIPPNLHVHFYNCQIGNLNLQGNNLVTFDGGVVNGETTAINSALVARGVTWSSNVTLTNCDIDLTTGSATGIWTVQGRTYIRADLFGWSLAQTGLILKGASIGRITRSTLENHSACAISVEEASYLMLSKCDSVSGVAKGIQLRDRAVLEAVDVTSVSATSGNAVTLTESSRAEFMNCPTVESPLTTFRADRKSFLVVNKSTLLKSSTEGVFFLDDSRVEIRDFESIEASSKPAITANSGSSVFAGQGTIIKSVAKCAIMAEESDIEVLSVQNLQSTSGKTVELDTSRATFIDVESISSQSQAAISAIGSRVSLIRVDSVQSVAAEAAVLESNSFLDGVDLDSISGQTNGISADDGSGVVLKRVQTLTGLTRNALVLSDGSSATLANCENITGGGGSGIDATGKCKVTVTKCTSVSGVAGSGIKIDSFGSLHLYELDSVTGSGSHGIEHHGGILSIKNVRTITGVSDGLNLTEVDTFIEGVESVSGSGNAITMTGGGAGSHTIEIHGGSYAGANGFDFRQVLVKTFNVSVGGAVSLKLQNSRHESVKDVYVANAEVSDSAFVTTDTSVNGEVDYQDSAVFDMLGRHGTFANFDGLAGAFLGTRVAGGFSSQSGWVAAKANFGPTTLDNDGVGHFGGQGEYKGLGSVFSARAGLPAEGVDYVMIDQDQVRMQTELLSFIDVSSTPGSAMHSQTSWTMTGTTTIVIAAPSVDIIG